MSYIIAHVAFGETSQSYPVNCERTDVRVGDEVVVRVHEQGLKWAKIVDLNYLNWNCRNSIECLASEAEFSTTGITVADAFKVNGLSNFQQLAVSLFQKGWTPRIAANRSYRKAYSATNVSQTCLILMRKNGIDVQVIEALPNSKIAANSRLSTSQKDGPFYCQTFHGSLNNIFERIDVFATAFLDGRAAPDKMLREQKAEKVLPKPPQRPLNDDLYSALGGSGEAIYLSDGVWLSS